MRSTPELSGLAIQNLDRGDICPEGILDFFFRCSGLRLRTNWHLSSFASAANQAPMAMFYLRSIWPLAKWLTFQARKGGRAV
jgi:hypothetical protein